MRRNSLLSPQCLDCGRPMVTLQPGSGHWDVPALPLPPSALSPLHAHFLSFAYVLERIWLAAGMSPGSAAAEPPPSHCGARSSPLLSRDTGRCLDLVSGSSIARAMPVWNRAWQGWNCSLLAGNSHPPCPQPGCSWLPSP